MITARACSSGMTMGCDSSLQSDFPMSTIDALGSEEAGTESAEELESVFDSSCYGRTPHTNGEGLEVRRDVSDASR